jgi:integrase
VTVGFIERRGPGRYRARYRGLDGRERSKTFERKVDAERWLATATADLVRGAWTDPALGRMTFADWVKVWENELHHLRRTTRDLNLGVVRNHLLPRFGSTPLARITAGAVKAMIAEELGQGRLSNSAIRRHGMVLSTILRAALDDGRIAKNPCDGVRFPVEEARDMLFLTAEQVAVLADAASPVHYRALILTAAWVGLRWGELAGLRVRNVDLLRARIQVREQVTEVGGRAEWGPPKTRAGIRTVTMPSALVDVLGGHFACGAVQRSGFAFPTPSGTVMKRANFRKVWSRTLAAAGFGGTRLAALRFHDLRHTAVALAIAEGAHPLAIKERLGHASITVTLDRYGGLFPSLDEALADGLDARLRSSLAASSRPEPPTVAYLPRSTRS